MALSEELLNVLELTRKEVLSHPNGELILPLRRIIWKTFGAFEIKEKYRASSTIGLKRRLKLATMCVEKVMNIWNEAFPNDKRPMRCIEVANEYVTGKTNYESIWNEMSHFVTDLDNQGGEERYYLAVPVGRAAISVLDVAIKDESILVYGNDSRLDSDYDAYDWDTSFCVAIAYSGSGPWDNTNIEKRREFWLWYINEAVPEAYMAFAD